MIGGGLLINLYHDATKTIITRFSTLLSNSLLLELSVSGGASAEAERRYGALGNS